jgi:hypothetical protein
VRRAYRTILLTLALLLGWISLAALSRTGTTVDPAAQATAFQTPTPGADGRIVYIVRLNDTLWQISALSGVPLDQLEKLNNLNQNTPLQVGQQLVLGFGQAITAQPTLAFQPTPTPTPVAQTGTGDICVSFFNDVNGNASQDPGEGLVAGGKISVARSDGTQVGAYTTDGVNEPHCFQHLPSGDYNVAAAAPERYNPTSSMNTPIHLEPGARAYVAFAVQASQSSTGSSSDTGGRSTLLGLLGLALLASAGLLTFFLARQRRRT